jgi:hypothetical protein
MPLSCTTSPDISLWSEQHAPQPGRKRALSSPQGRESMEALLEPQKRSTGEMTTEPLSHATQTMIPPVAHTCLRMCRGLQKAIFTPPGGNNKTPPEAVNRAGRAAGLYGGARTV